MLSLLASNTPFSKCVGPGLSVAVQDLAGLRWGGLDSLAFSHSMAKYCAYVVIYCAILCLYFAYIVLYVGCMLLILTMALPVL